MGRATSWLLWGIFLAVLWMYLPYLILLVNSFTPWKIAMTPQYKALLDFRRAFHEKRDPLPVPEIDARELFALPEDQQRAKFLELTKDLSHPVFIRNLLDKEALSQLGDLEYWQNNFGDEQLNCIDMSNESYRRCTVRELFDYNINQGRNIYSRTNHMILYRQEHLKKMLENPISKFISEPGTELYEIFIGFKSGGSPLHAAFGINLFKQIVGSKKWTFINPTNIPLCDVYASPDGASLLAIEGDEVTYSNATWLKRVERFEGVVNAGDALFNPTMWMHIVENLPGASENSLVIGSPERHFGLSSGWRTSWFMTSHVVAKTLMQKAIEAVTGHHVEIARDYMPVTDAESAKKFDDFILKRAIGLVGEFK